MTDTEIVDQLRSLYQLKGWPVLREATDRIQNLEHLHDFQDVGSPSKPVYECTVCGVDAAD